MTTLLCLDSSTGPASIAIVRGGEVLAKQMDADAHQQSSRLVSTTDALLRTILGDYSSVDAVVVTTGPGGFTGIRVALAAALGFALACDVPLIGISTLQTYAWQSLHEANPGTTAKVAINAWRNQAYMQTYIRNAYGMEAVDEALAIDIPDASQSQIGNLEGLVQAPSAPQAEYAGLWVQNLLTRGKTLAQLVQEYPADAYYIREPDAKPQTPFLAK